MTSRIPRERRDAVPGSDAGMRSADASRRARSTSTAWVARSTPAGGPSDHHLIAEHAGGTPGDARETRSATDGPEHASRTIQCLAVLAVGTDLPEFEIELLHVCLAAQPSGER